MSTANKLLQAASGGGDDLTYVEDVFSTDLWAGDGSSETITNGINFSGEGGMVWFARRTTSDNHTMIDTVRGGNTALFSTSQSADYSNSQMITSFNSDGFAVGSYLGVNDNNEDLVGWSFRKSPGFFDVVTYTGDGTSNRTISHNLGCKPGMIWVKRRNSASRDWQVWHRYSGFTYGVGHLNTNATWTNTGGDNAAFGSFVHSDTTFTLGAGSRLDDTNANGQTFVAYLFAGQGDSGSQIFGDDEDEAIIKCGSYTGNGTDKAVSVGFEPQWVIIKNTANTDDWWVVDMMRGVFQGSNDALLKANATDAEDSGADYINFDAGGFTVHTSYGIANENGSNYIYMAIRRPMKAPDYGTDVFSTSAGSSSGELTITSNFRVDFNFIKQRTGSSSWYVNDRLRGSKYVAFDSTAAESSLGVNWDRMTGWQHTGTGDYSAWSGWNFKRAAKFLDVVTYIGDGTSSRNIDHNLGVVPEFIVTKRRDANGSWAVYTPDLGITSSSGIRINSTDGSGYSQLTRYPSTPTSSVFTVGNDSDVNSNGNDFISYLFATLAGVSKVGSYTGTGSDLNVDCGFSAGARFVLIKRYGATGGPWIVFDSVRGIVAGNDPYILLNSTDAQVTGNDLIDPLSSGFTVTAGAGASLNASGGTYIFVAIA